jgi:hypothetical protein
MKAATNEVLMPQSVRLLVILGALFFGYALIGNYTALPGYIRFLERGGVSEAGNGFDLSVLMGATQTVLWLFSFQLGVLFLALAALIKGRAERRLLLGFLAVAAVWLVFAGLPSLPRPGALFYAGFGSAILVLIAAALWRWSNMRPALAAGQQRAHDYRLVAMIFFGLAAWDVCGFGSMGFMLNPEKASDLGSETLLVTQSTKVMIMFVLGWGFTFLSLRPHLGRS